MKFPKLVAAAAVALTSLQLQIVAVSAQPFGPFCTRIATNAAKSVGLAILPGITLAALGQGWAYSCRELADAAKGQNFEINGKIVGQEISLTVIDNSKSCTCPNQ